MLEVGTPWKTSKLVKMPCQSPWKCHAFCKATSTVIPPSSELTPFFHFQVHTCLNGQQTQYEYTRIYTMEIAWSYIILDHEGLWVLFGYLFTFLPSSDERIHTTKVVLHWWIYAWIMSESRSEYIYINLSWFSYEFQKFTCADSFNVYLGPPIVLTIEFERSWLNNDWGRSSLSFEHVLSCVVSYQPQITQR